MSFKSLLNVFIVCIVLIPMGCNQVKGPGNSHWADPLTDMEFVLIPKGKFIMGNSSTTEKLNTLELKPHPVNIDQDFWIGVTEVTQQQWQKIMGRAEIHPDKPSPFRNQQHLYPIVSVSFHDIQAFINKLNDVSEDSKFRLPTEAEWEYACRAGTKSAYHFGDTISAELSNYNAQIKHRNSRLGKFTGHPIKVASYPSNDWGLYDMHGNVFEWVSDWYAPYSKETANNPTGPSNGSLKVIRGGSWNFGAGNARSFSRRTHEPDLWGFSIGFRLVREPR